MMMLMKTLQPKIVLCELPPTGVDGIESWSPFCLKVHRALRLAGLGYESRHGRPSDFSRLNPAGQVPVLLVGDTVVRDSTAILAEVARLSDHFGGRPLLPRDPRAKAEAWLWEDWADRALNGYVVAARWADERNWPMVQEAYFGKDAPWLVRNVVAPHLRRRVLAGLHARDFLRAGPAALRDDFRRVLDFLEERAPLEGFWVTPDAPTVADLSIFAQLHAFRSALTAAQARELVMRPRLTDWLDRVAEETSRKAVRAASPLVLPRRAEHRHYVRSEVGVFSA